MTATVTPFRRDLKRELQALITFDGQPTVEELHHRHERMRLANKNAHLAHDLRTNIQVGLDKVKTAIASLPITTQDLRHAKPPSGPGRAE